MDYGAEEIGLFAPEPSDALREHAIYLGATLNRDLPVYTMDDMPKLRDTSVVPYINTPETESLIRELGQTPWGLPPEMVSSLKNKVIFHALVRGFGIEGLEVPEFRIANINNIPDKSKEVLKEASDMYSRYYISDYPLGAIIRAENSDGNYGSSIIKQDEKGRILVIPDADDERAEYFRKNDWTKALKYAQAELRESTSNTSDPQFVVSRFMDITDSPGMSLLVSDGQFESLGWNGQTMAKGTGACVGTTRYQPVGRYATGVQKAHEDQSAEAFAEFVRRTAKMYGISFGKVKGVINMDLMLPGSKEATLRERRGLKNGYYAAECNPRWTNYTDALLAVVGFTGRIPSIRELQTAAWNQVHTIDKKPLRGARAEVIREVLFDRDKEAKRVGDPDRAFMRMPGEDEIGVILTGNRKKAEEKVDLAIEKAGHE